MARDVDEFMNMLAVCKILFFSVQDLKDEEGFRKYLAESLKEFENPEVYDRFIEKHGFESDISKVYEIAKLGHTVKPFFIIKAIDEDYCDSHSLFGLDDQDFFMDCGLDEYVEVYKTAEQFVKDQNRVKKR